MMRKLIFLPLTLTLSPERGEGMLSGINLFRLKRGMLSGINLFRLKRGREGMLSGINLFRLKRGGEGILSKSGML